MVGSENIEAVIYDLDGTIIDTEKLHQNAWGLTSQEYSLGFSGEEIYVASKGISSRKTLENILPQERYDIIASAAEAKFRYLMTLTENDPIEVFTGFMDTFEALRKNNISMGICTSARKENVDALQRNRSSEISYVLNILHGKVAWKEMFKEGKPAAEPLLLILNMVGVNAAQALYVGDAVADYQCAQNARVNNFVYFCLGEPDSKIPVDVLRMNDHRKLLEYIG